MPIWNKLANCVAERALTMKEDLDVTKQLVPILLILVTVWAACKTQSPGQREAGWCTFRAPDGQFRVMFSEGRPSSRQLTHGDIRRTDYWRSAGGATFFVQVFESNRYSTDHSDEILRDYPTPASGGIEGKIVEESSIRLGRYLGRAVRIEGTTHAASGRVVLAQRAYVTDGRLYLVTAASAPGKPLSPLSDRFLASFALLK
jgi:hypothetical protein